jgi:hypothetical protein
VAAWFNAWTLFARSNAGIVGSNPTQGMDVCLHLFCVYVVLYAGSGLATGWCPIQGDLQTAEPQIDRWCLISISSNYNDVGCVLWSWFKQEDRKCCKRFYVLKKTPWLVVRKRTILTERPPLVSEVSAKFADRECRVVSAVDPRGR